MEFSPTNNIVKLCLQGMALEDVGKSDEVDKLFFQAWHEARVNFEKFLAAYYVSRHQKNISDRLEWFKKTLQLALEINDSTVRSAFPPLYLNIAKCYEGLNDPNEANKYYQLAASFDCTPSDKGPFYHGTKADLQVSDFLTPGGNSNYKSDLKMNHIYFTALINGAGLAAALAKGEGLERVYIVKPTGSFEDDPNVTNQKFPGNQTRSYRSTAPLEIIGEVTDWARLTPEDLQKFHERLADSSEKIIN
jgi:tetratricopeptide (TPR) repeat protein